VGGRGLELQLVDEPAGIGNGQVLGPVDVFGEGDDDSLELYDNSNTNPNQITLTDTTIPTSGTGLYYLVRAFNACGTGAFGAASSGASQMGMSRLYPTASRKYNEKINASQRRSVRLSIADLRS